jgi:hypothetical protein
VNTKYAAKLKFLPDESFDEGSHIDSAAAIAGHCAVTFPEDEEE